MPYPGGSLYPKTTGLYPGTLVPEVAEAPDTPAVTVHGAVEKLQPGRYMLRHIAPLAATEADSGVFNPLGKGFDVLGQTLYADPLPQQRIPTSPDFFEGKYSLRLYDAGDYELNFPNRDTADGKPWRERFSTVGHVEWLEIARESEVEFIGVVNRQASDRGKITITGYDPLFLLKKAFEQDWTGVMAPRDVIERYTELPVVVVGDEFKRAALGSFWSGAVVGGASSVAISEAAGLVLKAGTGIGDFAAVTTAEEWLGSAQRWTLRADITIPPPTVSTGTGFTIQLGLVNPGVGAICLNVSPSAGESSLFFESPPGNIQELAQLATPGIASGAHTLLIEYDGRWVRGYFDGQLIGYVEILEILGGPFQERILIAGSGGGGGTVPMTVNRMVARKYEPFLMRTANDGERVLPGTAATYPTGGLHGRFVAPSSQLEWWTLSLAPDPRNPGFPQYVEALTPGINAPAVPSGILNTDFAARWFGAVYLDLENNSEITFTLSGMASGSDNGRLWVGDTVAQNRIFGAWRGAHGGTSQTGKVKASVVGARKGWFPIILDYFTQQHATAAKLEFTAPTTGWTDPGGTVIAAGVSTIIPMTSLSPLGCVDARIQGSSYFDIIMEQAKNFGYQVRCEPMSLESGSFPGRIQPKARLGKDTDEVIEAGDLDKRSEVNNYTASLDATDSATSLKAFGSGIADGKGSQVAFEAISIPDAQASLFDMEAWLGAGDIAFPALLAARAAAELGVRLGSWENVEGEPIARDRLADTFPLTGAISQFRWQPSDAVRLKLPDVGIDDTTPRQMLQVVRNFTPEGRTTTSVGFRARPKDPLHTLRATLREATRSPRAYQRQYAPRAGNVAGSGSLVTGAGTTQSLMTLNAGERVVDARLVIMYLSSPTNLEILINGVNVTGTLGGGGAINKACTINVLSFARALNPPYDQRFYAQLKNAGPTSPVNVEFQLAVTLLV